MAEKNDAAGVEVRVLLAHGGHQPNHVITISAAELKARKAASEVDDDPDAVAYAKANEPQPEAKAEAKA